MAIKKIRTLTPAFVSAALLSLTGCYHTAYRTSQAPGGAVHEETANFFLYGLAGSANVDLDTLCPAGVSNVSSGMSFTDGLLATVTGGLYTPMSIVVECSGGTAYLLNPGENNETVAVVPVNAAAPLAMESGAGRL